MCEFANALALARRLGREWVEEVVQACYNPESERYWVPLMIVAAIIQARLGSTRLPRKVLRDLDGQTMLARVVRRVSRCENLDRIVVATTVCPEDEYIVAECSRLDTEVFRGSEDDVLDRFHRAAQIIDADVIVRVTADNPLLDPGLASDVIRKFLGSQCDYASNTLEPGYPIGLATEVMSREALGRAWQEARAPYQREHVTPYIYGSPELFRLLSVTGAANLSHLRWTVDVEEDFQFVSEIYREFGNQEFGMHEVLELLRRTPSLATINQAIEQKRIP